MSQAFLQASTPDTGIVILQSNRLAVLATQMIKRLRMHPLDPLTDEIIIVPNSGIGQWLKMRLAADPGQGGLGIAAALDMMDANTFVQRMYGKVLQDMPDVAAFASNALSFRLYRLLYSLLPQTGVTADLVALKPLHEFVYALPALTEDEVDMRRYQLATRLADLFERYQIYRDHWLQAWTEGEDSITDVQGNVLPLDAAQTWQPLVWRHLVAELSPADKNGHGQGRAEIHHIFLKRMQAFGKHAPGKLLPSRVSVFGFNALSDKVLEVLAAISSWSEILIFNHNPCRIPHWGHPIESQQPSLFCGLSKPQDISYDVTTSHTATYPLLQAWGLQFWSYWRLLQDKCSNAKTISIFDSQETRTLLQQVQDDILQMRSLQTRQDMASQIDPAQDQSLSFMIAHSPQREVEILHDQLLHSLTNAKAQGKTLHAHDILVMVPDIELYAPHIEAVFGRLYPTDKRYIPFHIAGRGLRHRHPLLIGIEMMLNLPQARFCVSEVLDLLDIPALRKRFGIKETDVPQLKAWIEDANIRWGLNAQQRATVLGSTQSGEHINTWQFGLQRMLLGFSNGQTEAWCDIEPLTEVGGLEAALVGQLDYLLHTLERVWQSLQQSYTPVQWSALLTEQINALFCLDDLEDQAVWISIQKIMERWLRDCECAGAEATPFSVVVLQAYLLEGIDNPLMQRNFMAGGVNFVNLQPMRVIPAREIWLLGMSDENYPHRPSHAEFDLVAANPQPGDCLHHAQERYLFLDILQAAHERLVFSWVGRSIRDNSERTPSVLVGQLRDYIEQGWQHAQPASSLIAALTYTYPMQPFSYHYFAKDRAKHLFSYAHEWQQAYISCTTHIAETPPKLDTPEHVTPIRLASLAQFLRYPVSCFYEQRLGIRFQSEDISIQDTENFVLDNLEQWQMRDILIKRLKRLLILKPTDPPPQHLTHVLEQAARGGALPLPPFTAGWQTLIQQSLQTALATYCDLCQQYPITHPAQEINIATDQVSLIDHVQTLRSNHARNETVQIFWQASRLFNSTGMPNWHHIIRVWPSHLAAQLKQPTTTHILGTDEIGIVLAPLDARHANTYLTQQLTAYLQGLTELLPLACKTGFARLDDIHTAKGTCKAASVYEDGYKQAGEFREHPAYLRFWPDYATLIQDERFDAYVLALYQPLYTHLQGGSAS